MKCPPKTKFLTIAFYVLKFSPSILNCLVPPLLTGMGTRSGYAIEGFLIIKKTKEKAHNTKFEEICLVYMYVEYLKNL
jgi:hypothetical protein